MTIHAAIDKATGDLFKPKGGGILRVKDARFVVQQVQSKLQTFLGEWLPDRSLGFLNLDSFGRGYDRFDIEDRVTRIVLTTQGVKSIKAMNTEVYGRGIIITFRASTIYGDIDLTVPWDNIQVRGL